MLLDIVRWEVIKLAALRRSPDGTRLRASAFRLLVSMLAHAREQDWQDDQQLITWPSYAELTKETALYRGSIGPARQELIAAGLILPLAGAHKRGGDDPIAAYKIHTTIIRSPDQRARGPAPRRAAPAIPEVQRGSAPGAGHAQCARVPVRLIDEEE